MHEVACPFCWKRIPCKSSEDAPRAYQQHRKGGICLSVENDDPDREGKEGRVPDESSGVDPAPQQDESEGGIARTGKPDEYKP